MFKFKTLKCHHCHSVVLNLPETEVSKLDGLIFMCECCGHRNLLRDYQFSAGLNSDFAANTINADSFAVQ